MSDNTLDKPRFSEITIEFCEFCGWFVRCPACGNNCCSGAYGKDKQGNICKVCEKAYSLQEKIPSKEVEDLMNAV